MTGLISDEDSFHNGYHYFIKAVEILLMPAVEQCEVMGFYNVGWELKNDLTAGVHLLSNNESILIAAEQSAILLLINELDKIPESVLVASDARDENIIAMKNPCWNNLREFAGELIKSLESATRKNIEYLK